MVSRMSEMLNDPLNLDLLECICQGEGVEVNINSLSKTFKKHRNTIKIHVNELLDSSIIEGPGYPLKWIFQEYPLLVLAFYNRCNGYDHSILMAAKLYLDTCEHTRFEEPVSIGDLYLNPCLERFLFQEGGLSHNPALKFLSGIGIGCY